MEYDLSGYWKAKAEMDATIAMARRTLDEMRFASLALARDLIHAQREQMQVQWVLPPVPMPQL